MNSHVLVRPTTRTHKLRGFVSVALVVAALGTTAVMLLAGAADAAPSSARGRSVTTDVNQAKRIPVLTSESLAAGDFIEIVKKPSHGDVSPEGDGTITYKPELAFLGDDEFTYRVCPPNPSVFDRCSTPATVRVQVVASLQALAVTFAVIQTVILILAIRLLDPYEHEPLTLIGLMAVWGAAGATLIAWDWNDRIAPTPVVEEVAKGTALVVVFVVAYWSSRRFGGRRLEGATAGLVYGAAIGLGFAFTEDVNYGLFNGLGDLVARRNYLGYGALTHSLFTAVFGVGLGLAFVTRRKVMRVVWPALGMLTAIALHWLNNDLDGALGNAYINLVFVVAGVAIWFWLAQQRGVITTELTTEARHGLVSSRDIKLTPRYWRRQQRRWSLVRSAQLQRARAEEFLHVQLARLAFAKRRYDESAPSEARNVTDLREGVRRAKAEVRFARLVEARDADARARQPGDGEPTDEEQVVPTP
jgi:RsiW-degrading membrane proteinase PrsW (M82 family)